MGGGTGSTDVLEREQIPGGLERINRLSSRTQRVIIAADMIGMSGSAVYTFAGTNPELGLGLTLGCLLSGFYLLCRVDYSER